MAKEITQESICQWFGISRQAHAQMCLRRELEAAIGERIAEAVREVRRKHPRLGGRKLLHKLQAFLEEEGIKIGRDKFFDLLRERDLLVPRKRKGRRTTFPGGIRSENLLQNTTIKAANQAYVVDITYIETDQAFIYLALVTDLYSRKIVGWDLSHSLSLEGALRAMKMAVAQADGPLKGLIHHSDHGIQYASGPYLHYLRQEDIRPSMGRVGNCYDNAVAERVNGILKLEYLLDQRFPDFDRAQQAVAEAIHLYNSDRPHLSLDYQTPEQVYRLSVQKQKDQDGIGDPHPFPSQRKTDGFGQVPMSSRLLLGFAPTSTWDNPPIPTPQPPLNERKDETARPRTDALPPSPWVVL